MSDNRGLGRWIAGILAAVISGVILAIVLGQFPSESRNDTAANGEPDTTDTQASPSTRIEDLNGDWTLVSWDEVQSAITLGVAPTAGALTVFEDGAVTWSLDIDDLFSNDAGPQAVVTCSGRLPLHGDLESSVADEAGYTANLRSISRMIATALCGGGIGAANSAFTIAYAPTSSPTRLEMANENGRFAWQR